MTVSSAFNTAVSGMTAQATALSNISQNISNSSTVGYKQVDTQFADMVLGSGTGGDLANSLAGVSTQTQSDNTTAGSIQSTGVSTDIAISGTGFMVVNTNATSGTGTYLATRAGSFRPDANGNLVNAAGYYLQGVPLNANGTAVGGNSGSTLDSLSTVNISNISSSASPTTTASFAANLPSTEPGQTGQQAQTSTIDYYDSLGTAQTLTLTFTPSTTTANTWDLKINDSAPGATNPIADETLAFNGSGANAGELASVTTNSGATYSSTTGDLALVTGSGNKISLNIGAPNTASGMTQYDGAYTTTNVTKDGSSFGLLQSVNITSSGVVDANFSNGSSRPIYQLYLANTPSPDNMAAVNGDAYAFSSAAGVPTLETPGEGFAGTTDGGSLEGSNVDITTQLTNLIQTQRAYSSNATVVQTGSQMLQTATQLVQG